MMDTHAHLDFSQFDEDRSMVIDRFLKKNGQAIINIGVDAERNKKSFEVASQYQAVFFTVGYHPEEAGKVSVEKVVDDLRSYLRKRKLVAIGEIGLDYFHKNNNKNAQKDLFKKQLQIAKQNGLPVVIHCRDAYEDVFEIINKKEFIDIKMVLHCYGGSVKDTEKFLSLENLNFSFTGNITFSKKDSAEIFQVVKMIPLSRIMIETDCPFLAPQFYRGKRNEPVYVLEVIKQIARVKNFLPIEVEKITDQNAIKFFGIKNLLEYF